MDPIQFEHFVADLWSAQEWNTRVTGEQNDRGVDIVATRDSPIPEKHLIQAKRYGPNNSVGSPDVQQYSSLKRQEPGTDVVTIVTSGRFSKQAEGIAQDLNVKLIDGDDLYNLVRSNDLFKIVESYIETGKAAKPPSASRLEAPDQDDSGFSLGWNKTIAFGVLMALAVTAVVGAAGMFAVGNYGTTGGGPLSVGESTTHGGLQFSVTNYTTTEKLGDPESNAHESDERVHYEMLPATAEPGSKFLLIQVQVTHIGENERQFPKNWEVRYKRERMNRVGMEQNVSILERTIEPYSKARVHAGAHSGAYPGTAVNGWIAFEVPTDMGTSDAIVKVEYGGRYGPPDAEMRTLTWELASN